MEVRGEKKGRGDEEAEGGNEEGDVLKTDDREPRETMRVKQLLFQTEVKTRRPSASD